MRWVHMAATKHPHVGVGLYSLSDAARILNAPPSTLRYWIKPDSGFIHRHFDPSEKTLTFNELMELHFVKLFTEEGVSVQTIRKAAEAAAKKYRTTYPFSVKRFDTDGKTVFATLVDDETDEVRIEDLRRGQYVFEHILRPFFRKLDYDTSIEPSRFWPMEKAGRIVLDPTRKFGKPIDADTGIPTRTLYDAVKAARGRSTASVADWFGIPVAAVDAAVEFERSIAA